MPAPSARSGTAAGRGRRPSPSSRWLRAGSLRSLGPAYPSDSRGPGMVAGRSGPVTATASGRVVTIMPRRGAGRSLSGLVAVILWMPTVSSGAPPDPIARADTLDTMVDGGWSSSGTTTSTHEVARSRSPQHRPTTSPTKWRWGAVCSDWSCAPTSRCLTTSFRWMPSSAPGSRWTSRGPSHPQARGRRHPGRPCVVHLPMGGDPSLPGRCRRPRHQQPNADHDVDDPVPLTSSDLATEGGPSGWLRPAGAPDLCGALQQFYADTIGAAITALAQSKSVLGVIVGYALDTLAGVLGELVSALTPNVLVLAVQGLAIAAAIAGAVEPWTASLVAEPPATSVAIPPAAGNPGAVTLGRLPAAETGSNRALLRPADGDRPALAGPLRRTRYLGGGHVRSGRRGRCATTITRRGDVFEARLDYTTRFETVGPNSLPTVGLMTIDGQVHRQDRETLTTLLDTVTALAMALIPPEILAVAVRRGRPDRRPTGRHRPPGHGRRHSRRVPRRRRGSPLRSASRPTTPTVASAVS